MTPGTSYHNPHFHVDGLVVLHILSDLDLHVGRCVAWIEGISVCGFYPRLVRPFPCIHKTCEMYVNLSMATDHNIIIRTSLRMAWCFADSAKS